MDEMNNEDTRPVNPRRRKRSQAQIFKETYLPAIIAGVALLLVLIFIIGSVSRGISKRKQEKEASIAASSSAAALKQEQDAEAQRILTQAEALASGYNYSGALDLIDSFSGNISDYEELVQKRQEYSDLRSQMSVWSNPEDVVNLSFQLLIADPARAFADDDYGESYQNNFVTITEFGNILQQLYNNGYMLVDLDDIVTTKTNEAGVEEIVARTLYLPQGKKPLMITQTNVNYYTYMVDSDDDGEPDQGGAGFASRLILDDSGKITCEMVGADGTTLTGAYDLVPLLDAFIAEHPDFSYNGAKATLAVTGYDGLFGYRTNPSVKETKGEEYYNQQVQGATAIIQALRADGYELACYTYDNLDYGGTEVEGITSDLASWTSEVTPILGQTDILVFAQNSDIAEAGSVYSGPAYEALKSVGFRYFLGFCGTSGKSWTVVDSNMFRQGRLMVSGANMSSNSEWFTDLFDVSTVLDPARGTSSDTAE